jgi:hypothetical protein
MIFIFFAKKKIFDASVRSKFWAGTNFIAHMHTKPIVQTLLCYGWSAVGQKLPLRRSPVSFWPSLANWRQQPMTERNI